MRRTLLILVLASCSGSASAASGAHCDATPFSLGKPAAATATNVQPKPVPQAVQPVARKPEVKAEGKQRLLANCKAGKAKKKGG
jgi:hypothetical protein